MQILAWPTSLEDIECVQRRAQFMKPTVQNILRTTRLFCVNDEDYIEKEKKKRRKKEEEKIKRHFNDQHYYGYN